MAFTWYPNGSFLMRIGFGLNVNLDLNANSPVLLSLLHNEARNRPMDFNRLSRDFGGVPYVETPIVWGRVQRFMDGVLPANYPGNDALGWWFYGRDFDWKTNALVIRDNAMIAQQLRRSTDAVMKRRMWFTM